MTTAARPTWAPAKGGNEQGGTRIFGPSQKNSSRDITAHTTLKPRKEGQDTHKEIEKRNLMEELADHERRHFFKDEREFEDRDRQGDEREYEDRNHQLLSEGDEREYEDSDESDDEDDTEALLAELEQIKQERALQKLRKDKEEQEDSEQMNNIPISFNVKRRWDDDVVFKNQARGEQKAPKRFINDTIRSDIHRKFLHRNMK